MAIIYRVENIIARLKLSVIFAAKIYIVKALRMPITQAQALSNDLPKASLLSPMISLSLTSFMIFLKASSQPYNLTYLIPAIVYEIFCTLLSLYLLIY